MFDFPRAIVNSRFVASILTSQSRQIGSTTRIKCHSSSLRLETICAYGSAGIVRITHDTLGINNVNFSLIARYLRDCDDNANGGYNYAPPPAALGSRMNHVRRGATGRTTHELFRPVYHNRGPIIGPRTARGSSPRFERSPNDSTRFDSRRLRSADVNQPA